MKSDRSCPLWLCFLRGCPECTLAWRRQTPALIERMNELTTQRGVFDFCSIFSTKCLSDCLRDLSHKYMALSGGLTSLLCVERISPPFSTHTAHMQTHAHIHIHIHTLKNTHLLCLIHRVFQGMSVLFNVWNTLQSESHSKRMHFFNHYGKEKSLTAPVLLPLCHCRVPLNGKCS